MHLLPTTFSHGLIHICFPGEYYSGWMVNVITQKNNSAHVHYNSLFNVLLRRAMKLSCTEEALLRFCSFIGKVE